MKNLYSKILKVMQQVNYLQKDDSVGFGKYQYKAISEEKVTTEVRKALIENGLVIIPVGIEERREDFEVIRNDGKEGIDRLTTIKTTYLIADTESGETIEVCSAGAGVDTQDKGIGKALTYAYKYLLLRTFAIPTGEDPDKEASRDNQPVRKNNPAYVTNKERETLMNNAIELHNQNAQEAIKDLLKHLKVERTDQILASDLGRANQYISDWMKL